jgi:hypothetical protein
VKTRLLAALSTAALTGTLVATAAPAHATTVYSSCAALHRVWPYGVAKSYAAGTYQVRHGHHRPASGPQAQKVYWANYRGRDADRDGTACEN